jgi:protein-serine/threonine kinase
MPSPAFHANLSQSASFPPTQQQFSPPRPSHSWKSVFRFANPSSRKLAASDNTKGSALRLDTHALSSRPNGTIRTPITPSAKTPVSLLSVDPRPSYNSSNSSSSNHATDGPYRHLSNHGYPSPRHQPSTDVLSIGHDTQSRLRTKSEKNRQQRTVLGRSMAQTADPSQSSFALPSPLPSPPTSSRPSRLTPKGMGASATRFLRRVASAPNAKNMFLGHAHPTTPPPTKNGFLAPQNPLPPLPPVISGSLEEGTDSLETMSSSSSRGRPQSRPVRAHNPAVPLKASASNSNLERPAKPAFRRTYSSNSIKVRQVSFFHFASSDGLGFFFSDEFFSGRSRSLEFLENKDARQRRRWASVPCAGEEIGQAFCNERLIIFNFLFAVYCPRWFTLD